MLFCKIVVYHFLSPDINIRFLLKISVIFIYHIFACFLPEIILHFHPTVLPWGSSVMPKRNQPANNDGSYNFLQGLCLFSFWFFESSSLYLLDDGFFIMGFHSYLLFFILCLENATYKTWYMLKHAIERGTDIQVFFQWNGASYP